MKPFKLRCALHSHEKDVRAVCATYFPDNGFVSGSRDVTAKVWSPRMESEEFTESQLLSGHTNFISCVCVMPPDDQHSQGLIVTGSHDKTILVYALNSATPLYKLEGHNDTVCSLSSGKFGTLLSGSWDTTAKVWLNRKCVMTLQGHTAAVWATAVMPEGGFMLTGSADKSIRLWKGGKCEKIYTGHVDCVRGLAVLSATEFLSCSNDASVRRWSTSSTDCLAVYHSHTNFVYSVSLLPNGQDFITTSEDRTLKIWKDGECCQTIAHPATSVWTACVLPNGDIVTGDSNGTVHVFTQNPDRMADPEAQKAFEEMVAQSSIPTQIGDLKTEDIPDARALYNPGKTDGQTIMVKNEGKIEAHQWSAVEGVWKKIGDVVGGSGGTTITGGKTTYEGKEYDYVFDVELTEGRPPLKLPYNAGQDPWHVAHQWLEKNELSPLFLDQVANFIQDQTRGVTIGQQAPSEFRDPFTGEGRYVPGASTNGTGGSGSDPFTSSGRYIPGKGDGAAGSSESAANQFFPKTSYLSFETANVDAILAKLKELNGQAGPEQEDSTQLDGLAGLVQGGSSSEEQMALLWKILHWPSDLLFPALDILRLSIRWPTVNKHFCGSVSSSSFINFLIQHLSPDPPEKSLVANQMLSLRVICNAFKQPEGQKLLTKPEVYQRIVGATVQVFAGNQSSTSAAGNKNLSIAAATVLLNYAIAAHLGLLTPEDKVQCLSAIGNLAETMMEAEVTFRLLVALGTVMHRDKTAQDIAKAMNMETFVNKCLMVEDPEKVSACAKHVLVMLS